MDVVGGEAAVFTAHVEEISNMYDRHGQILALSFRQQSILTKNMLGGNVTKFVPHKALA
jgi:hypothetical protein